MLFPPRSAYLHIPFCHRRCFYCDFAVVPLGDRAGSASGEPGAASIATYLDHLQLEIAAAPAGPPLSTVYLGGGTPSLLSPGQVAQVLGALRQRFGLAEAAEISLELDPASFDQQRLEGYLTAGVNRVSLGGQSFDDEVLALLGRRHRVHDLHEAINWLAEAYRSRELASWSLDLIQAIPGQGHDSWRAQLRQAVACQAPHLSIYDLTIEPGTVFDRRREQGQLQLPNEDLAADLMEITWTELTAAGFGHYEISNYAQPGHASRHNRVYWSGAGWWGFGMGATAAPWGARQARPRTRQDYADWVASPPPVSTGGMPLDERLLVGLRRREGVPLPALLAETGLDQFDSASALAELRQQLAPWLDSGLLLEEGPRWRLSDPGGLALSNGVLRVLMNWCSGRGAPALRSSVGAPPPQDFDLAAKVD